MSKEHWFRLYEEKLFELVDEGMDPNEAQETASAWAFDEQREQFADYADMKYQEIKDKRNGL